MPQAAVTGVGVLASIGSGADEFAGALRAGRCGIARDADAAPLAPPLTADLRGFDLAAAVAARMGLPEQLRHDAVRAGARAPLPVQASVAVALEAWEAAELHRACLPPERVSLVVAGHNLGGRHADGVRARFDASPVRVPGRYALQFLDTDHVGVVSDVLRIHGEGFTVGGASASGNAAIISAARLVAAGAADAVLVMGALTDLSPLERQSFFNLGAVASGGCRPFDVAAEGFVPGHGAACLVLESAESVRQRAALPLAWVTGYAQRLDGNRLADPSVVGEARVLTETLRAARLRPEDVDYVNTHGTGSPLGDAVEAQALRHVFGDRTPGPWVNATKGLAGHCLCAAGVVEAVATVLQLRDGFVHPNSQLDAPIDEELRFAGAEAHDVRMDHALSSGFGLGGFNTCVALAREA